KTGFQCLVGGHGESGLRNGRKRLALRSRNWGPEYQSKGGPEKGQYGPRARTGASFYLRWDSGWKDSRHGRWRGEGDASGDGQARVVNVSCLRHRSASTLEPAITRGDVSRSAPSGPGSWTGHRRRRDLWARRPTPMLTRRHHDLVPPEKAA